MHEDVFFKPVSAFNYTHCELKKDYYNINLSHTYKKIGNFGICSMNEPTTAVNKIK